MPSAGFALKEAHCKRHWPFAADTQHVSIAERPAAFILYRLIPLWILAGFADWLCHRASRISMTAGPKESAIHLLMSAEIGIPLLAGLFLEINAFILLIMAVGLSAHEATIL